MSIVSQDLKTVLEFKSSSFNVPALILDCNKLPEIKKELQQKISQAPDFFKYSPLVIDLHRLTEQNLTFDLQTFIQTLRELNFLPIGIQGGTKKQHKTALEMGIPMLSVRLSNEVKHKEKTVESPAKQEEDEEQLPDTVIEVSVIESKLVTYPVRSGQRIYSKGDLIVLAQVSAGAELLAEGNIHVYASLRGRALAGVQGNTESRIFCTELQAELISIAGNYRIRDEQNDYTGNKPVQIYLQDKSLIIKEL